MSCQPPPPTPRNDLRPFEDELFLSAAQLSLIPIDPDDDQVAGYVVRQLQRAANSWTHMAENFRRLHDEVLFLKEHAAHATDSITVRDLLASDICVRCEAHIDEIIAQLAGHVSVLPKFKSPIAAWAETTGFAMIIRIKTRAGRAVEPVFEGEFTLRELIYCITGAVVVRHSDLRAAIFRRDYESICTYIVAHYPTRAARDDFRHPAELLDTRSMEILDESG